MIVTVYGSFIPKHQGLAYILTAPTTKEKGKMSIRQAKIKRSGDLSLLLEGFSE